MAKALFAHEVLYVPMPLFNIHEHKKFVVLMFKYDPDESDLLKRYESKSINLTELSDHDRLEKVVKYFSREPKPGANFVILMT